MYYKGYLIDTAEAALLYDILQAQKEMLAELKKLNSQPESEDDDCIGLTDNEVPEQATNETTTEATAGYMQAQMLDSSKVELEDVEAVATIADIEGSSDEREQAEQPQQSDKPKKPAAKRKSTKKKTQSRKTTK